MNREVEEAKYNTGNNRQADSIVPGVATENNVSPGASFLNNVSEQPHQAIGSFLNI